MIRAIQTVVRGTDSAIARLYLSLFRERSALLCFLFHSLFRDRREMERNLIDPLDRTTVADLRELIEYYVSHGYRFVSPTDLLAGLEPGRKYAMLTFDDGYYNNFLALPVLEEFNVPAVFFISSNHVLQQKCFWWDVLHRQRMAQGASPGQVYREGVEMKFLRNGEIEGRLLDRFGPQALTPVGDVDRPFNADELRTFGSHPLVHLGNHTADHAILTNYSSDEARQQIAQCQEDLATITGTRPSAIAYPNGAYNAEVLSSCADANIRLGFTIRPEKSTLPLSDGRRNLLTLGRFVPHAEAPMASQCRTYRSDLLIYGTLRSGYLKLMRGRISN